MSSRPTPITDPDRIRALAHPTRLDLLEFLRNTDEATATECAEHIGESVASCSFHLRMLEKYGFIERAERRGREKPWRVRDRGPVSTQPDHDVPGSFLALHELATLTVARESDRILRYLAQTESEPTEWLEATTLTSSSFWATVDEMAELSRAIREITDRFNGRSEDPSLRPPGARPSRLFAAVNPDPPPPQESR